MYKRQTPDLVDDLFDLGVSVITTGNHAWDKKETVSYTHLDVYKRQEQERKGSFEQGRKI